MSFEQSVKNELQTLLDSFGDHAPRNLHRTLVDRLEKTLIQTMLDINMGNQSQTAEMLGMNRATLRDRLKRFNIK